MITDIQKASLTKRFAAGLLDAMLLFTFAVGFMWMLMSLLDYNSYHKSFQDGLARYEAQYGVDFSVDRSTLDAAQLENFNNAYKAANEDPDVSKNFTIMMNLMLLTTTFGILLSIVVLEFVIPLLLKNGQTIGKKVFSIGLVRVDSVQLTPVQLFVRTILGKFTVETMIPVYIIIMLLFNATGIIGIFILAAILLTQVIMLALTKTNSLIHDSLAGTVAVDLSSQMVFKTTDDLIAYKKKIHAEQAARSNY